VIPPKCPISGIQTKICINETELNITKEEIDDFSPEYFFHLAATFERSIETYNFWEENYHHNIRLRDHLMTSLKDSKTLKKVIFASSYLVYNPNLYSFGKPTKKPVSLSETEPISPRNLCGAAKLFHEVELQFLNSFSHNYKYKIVGARIFRVYGGNSRDVISRWIKNLLKGEEITLYKKECYFDYIYANEVAEGLIKLAESPAEGVINLGSGNARRVEEVINVLKRYFPKMKIRETDIDILYESSQANMDKFRKITGWTPKKQLEEAIPELISFYKKSKFVENIPNTNFNVLVTSISRKVPLLNAVKKANLKLANTGKLFGADINENCIGRYFVDVFLKMPQLTELSINEIIEYCRDNKISCIIPTRDSELLFFAVNKQKFLKNGIKLMVSNYNAVEICLDKLKFYKKVTEMRFPTIKTVKNINELNCNVYVVKERWGAGSRNIGLNLTRKDAITKANNIKEAVFQPYITGKEFSVDLYISLKGKTKGVVVRERQLIVDGESQITATIKDKKLEQICSSLAEKLGLYGHIVFQVIKDVRGNFYIIECNPRFGGASTLSIEVGLDSFYWFLLESFGVDVDNYPFIRSKTEKKLVRHAEDMIV
ncbi:MAG TPA: epimerase, partial [Elusimicrobia bacterium]|nr:epimerase [Elusimicrobiota bacterium]